VNSSWAEKHWRLSKNDEIAKKEFTIKIVKKIKEIASIMRIQNKDCNN